MKDIKLTKEGQFDNSMHPCFSTKAHFKYGRLHLPVSPKCNIQCNFCKRTLNKLENRPGVTRKLLTPQDALNIVGKALDICPEITVAGIAGPGDTLATPHALDTFNLIHKNYPHLILCMSTNGLMLKEYAQSISDAGVRTLTVTVNGVDPEIVKNICSYIYYNGRLMRGTEAANWLISAQFAGIKKIIDLGITVKVNTVLIPGVNDNHVGEVAKACSKLGVSTINIIPLIPQNKMITLESPDIKQLSTARKEAEKYIKVFHNCNHCRADACGIPGKNEDLGHLLYEYPMEETFSHG